MIEIQGTNDAFNYLNLTNGGTSRSGLAGGRTDMVITGTGSQLLFSSQAGVVQVGRARGTATLQVQGGGSVDGAYYLSVGRDAATGTLNISGAGSFVRLNNMVNATTNAGTANNALAQIGRSGTGTVNVSNGGQLLIEGRQFLDGGTSLQLGFGAASSGTLNIDGAGSLVKLQSFSVLAGGGPAEARNPHVSVGRDGNGVLSITNGGKLVLDGGGVSTSTDRRSTSFYVGGFSDTVVGGKGIATVSGAGSEIRLTGTDTFIGVGIGPQSSGQLTVSNQALVSGIGMNVGRSGGVGVLKVDGAQLSFSGQQTAGNLAGAFLGIGHGGGVGVATITNGSTVTMTNLGSAGASLTLGGVATTSVGTAFPGGDGSLTLSGASRINIVAAPGRATLRVADDGSALLRVRGASTIDVGDGNTVVGRLSGSDGTLLISEGSTLTTGWLGVGRNKTATGDVDGGTGTINGTVVNHGIFAPGNSPGTLEITGGYSAEVGSRMILEVQADGSGGFSTDHVIFGQGQTVDLSHLKVEFRFLGTTNPNDFQASQHFDVGNFFQVRAVGGGTAALAPEAFSRASFSASSEAYAISNFSFSAADGAAFTAVPVPEPGTWLMLVAGLVGGLVGFGGMARRHPA